MQHTSILGASDEDTAKPLQKPSLIVTLSCPEIARFVTEDADSDEELAEQDMYGGEDSDDEGPEPLSEAQLAYFYAHFVDMDETWNSGRHGGYQGQAS